MVRILQAGDKAAAEEGQAGERERRVVIPAVDTAAPRILVIQGWRRREGLSPEATPPAVPIKAC